jgi:energy-converting hydrogenase B subunit D
VTGTAVAVLGDPLRQTLVLAIYGFALTLLFFVFQAPDVALSELVVSGVGLPVIILAALRKVAQQSARRERQEEAEE